MYVGDWACASAHAPASTMREVNTAILTTPVRCLDLIALLLSRSARVRWPPRGYATRGRSSGARYRKGPGGGGGVPGGGGGGGGGEAAGCPTYVDGIEPRAMGIWLPLAYMHCM